MLECSYVKPFAKFVCYLLSQLVLSKTAALNCKTGKSNINKMSFLNTRSQTMKLAMMTSKKAMYRSIMSMGNFLLTDYKVHNVSYRRKYVFPNPVFKS